MVTFGTEEEGVPIFGTNGKILTDDERKDFARRNGICSICLTIKTHKKIRWGHVKPITNENVHEGICLPCRLKDAPANSGLPANVVEAFNERNGLGNSARSSGSSSRSHLKHAGRGAPRSTSVNDSVSLPRPQDPRHSNVHSPSSHHSTIGTNSRDRPARPSPRSAPLIQQYSPISSSSMGTATLGEKSATLDVSESSIPNLVSTQHQPHTNGDSGSTLPTAPNLTDSFSSVDSTSLEFSTAGLQQGSNRSLQHGSNRSVRSNKSMSERLGSNSSLPRSSRQNGSASGAYDDDNDGAGVTFHSPQALLDSLSTTSLDKDRLSQVLFKVRNLPTAAPALVELESAVIDALVGVASSYPDDPKVLSAAFGALWRINAEQKSGENDSSYDDANSGVCTLLMDTLRYLCDSDPKLCEWTLGALTSLALSGGPRSRADIVNGDGIHLVLEKIRLLGEPHAFIFEWACRCLQALVYPPGGDDNQEIEVAEQNAITVQREGGVSIIVKAMQRHPKEPQALVWGMKVLWRLQIRSQNDKDSTDYACRQMIESDFVQLGEKILRPRSAPPPLFTYTAEVLARLLVECNDPTQHMSLTVWIPSVVRVIGESKDELVQESGCRLLASFCSGNSDDMRSSDTINIVLKVMTKRPDCLSLAECGSWTIWKLSQDSSGVQPAQAGKIFEVLADLVHLHGESKHLVLSLCGCVRNLWRVVASDGNITVFEVLARVVASFPGEPDLVGQIVEALVALSAHDPAGTEDVFRLLDLSLIIRQSHMLSRPALLKLYQLFGVMACRSHPVRETLVSYGMLGEISTQLTSQTDEEFWTILLNLISLLVVSDPLEEVVVPGELFQSVAGVLRNEFAPRHVTSNACIALHNLILVSATPVQGLGVTGDLVRLISGRTNSVDLSLKACGVLWAIATRYPNECLYELDASFRAVMEFLSRHCDEGTPYHGHVLSVAASALASITRLLRSNPIIFDGDDIDAMMASVYKTLENECEEVGVLVDLALAMEDLYHVNEDVMVQVGFIVVVVDIMVDRESSALVQEIGCRILAKLSAMGDTEIRLSILQTDGIDMMVRALSVFQDSAIIHSHACKAFSHLCSDEESKFIILSQGGIKFSASAATRFQMDREVLENAWLALLSLTTDIDTHEGLIIETGIIEAAIDTMSRFPLVDSLQDSCMGVLNNISSASAKIRRLIAQARGVDEIVCSIQEYIGNPKILKRALSALAAMIVNRENGNSFDHSTTIKAVLSAMMASVNVADVQTVACVTLERLARFNRETLLQSRGMDAVFYSMQVHYTSLSVQEAACQALAALTSGNDLSSRPIVATEGQIRELVSAMVTFPDSELLQANACTVLCNLLYWPDNVSVVQRSEADVKRALESASLSYPRSCSGKVDEALSVLYTVY